MWLVPTLVRNRRLVALFAGMVILPAVVFSVLMVRAIANEQLRNAYGIIERQRQIVRLTEGELNRWLFAAGPDSARSKAILSFITADDRVHFPELGLELPLTGTPRVRPFDAAPQPGAPLTPDVVTAHYYPRIQVFLRDLSTGRHTGAQYFLRLRALVVRPRGDAEGYVIGIEPVVEHVNRHLARLSLSHPFTAKVLVAEAEGTTPSAADTYGLVSFPFFEVAFADTGLPAVMHVRRHAFAYAMTALVVISVLGSVFMHRAVSQEMRLAQLRKDFVAAVSHEFRSPLSSITMLAERLVSQRSLTSEQLAEYHRIIDRDSQRLSVLVSRLLEFGRIEEGRAVYARAPVDLIAVAREAIDALHGTIDRSRIRFAAAAPATVVGDRTAISHAIQNLVDNAAKYSPPDAPIDVECTARDGRVVLTVRDAGIGVRADEQQKIFDKFYRGQDVSARNIQGVGIGLSLVKHVMDAHQGSVSVESRSGAGSTFALQFPSAAT